MQRSTVVVIGLFVALGAGCSKSSTDTARPAGESRDVAADPPAGNDRSLMVSGVYLDPGLASSCGITGLGAFFEFDSAQVEPGDSGALAQLATCLSSGPLQGQRVVVVGHADPRGTDEYNLKLGRSRAQSVEGFLVERGVTAANVAVETQGERGADPAQPEEWPYDRRVDIRLAP
jgi:peptidoglycan-associated lipoprotein